MPDISGIGRRATNAVILALQKKSSVEERKIEEMKLDAAQKRLRFRKELSR